MTTLSPEQEWLVVEIRKSMFLAKNHIDIHRRQAMNFKAKLEKIL